MRTALSLCALMVLAACAPPTTKTDASQASEPAAMSAEAEGPVAETAMAVSAVPRGQYSAVSRTAVSITGDLTLADNALTFARAQTYRTEIMPSIEASQQYAPGATLAQLLGIPATTGLELRRVTNSQIGSGAPNGGLCGRDTVTFVTLAAATDNTNMPALWLAAFKGTEAPGTGGGAASDLCGYFTYAPASL